MRCFCAAIVRLDIIKRTYRWVPHAKLGNSNVEEYLPWDLYSHLGLGLRQWC